MSMLSTRARQSSLKNFHPSKKSQTFSPAKLLPTISQHRQIQKSSAKELTQIISKFQHSNKKEELKYSQQLLRSSIAVIRAFSVTQNNFQQLFADLYKVLRRFTFALQDQKIMDILAQYKVKEGCSYRRACFLIDEGLENLMSTKDNRIKELAQTSDQIKKELITKQAVWQKQRKLLEEEVERYRQLTDGEYVCRLEQEIQSLKINVNQLNAHSNFLLKENQQFSRALEGKEIIIHELNFEIAKRKTQIYDLNLKANKVEVYFSTLKDRFDGLLVKMMGIKEVIEKVETENEQLVSQRQKLVNRAAVGFEDLTPRPKYKQIFKTEFKNQLNSSESIFASLLETSKISHKEIVQKIILKKKNYKLEQSEAIRAQVVEDIIAAKQEMKKMNHS